MFKEEKLLGSSLKWEREELEKDGATEVVCERVAWRDERIRGGERPRKGVTLIKSE